MTLPDGPDWTIDMPPDWKTGEWRIIEPVAEGALPDGNALLVGGTLDDGTNFMALSWPGGQRWARLGPATRWAIQEHFEGELPDRGREVVLRMWSVTIEGMVSALRRADAEFGRPES